MSRGRVLLGATGIAAMGWAAWLVLTGGVVTPPVAVGAWLVAVVIAHDVVLAPIIVGLGWLASRSLPARLRPATTVAFVVVGCVVVMSAPLWLGQLLHRLPTANPSVDPLDYPRNVLVVCAAIVLVVGAGAAVRERRNRGRPDGEGRGTLDRLPPSETPDGSPGAPRG